MVWSWLKKLNCFKKTECLTGILNEKNAAVPNEENDIVPEFNNVVKSEVNVERIENNFGRNTTENFFNPDCRCCICSENEFKRNRLKTSIFEPRENLQDFYPLQQENKPCSSSDFKNTFVYPYQRLSISNDLKYQNFEPQNIDTHNQANDSRYSTPKTFTNSFHSNINPETLKPNHFFSLIDHKAPSELIKNLHDIISTTTEYYIKQSKIIFVTNGTICNIEKNEFYLTSDDEIQEANKKYIRERQTKVQLKSNPPTDILLLCTIISHGTKHLKLYARNFDLSKINGKFDAFLYPNFKQNEYAKRGVKAIESDAQMLKKLCIGTLNNPKIHVLENSGNEIYRIFATAVKTILPTLICTQTNADVENIILNLQDFLPQQFNDGLIIRLVTLLPPYSENEEKLQECTKKLSETTNFNKIIICTLGVAPKLAENGIKKDFFANIFIINAQKSSELDCWMVLGILANVNTKIFLCGNTSNNQKVVSNYMVSSKNNTSMFSRLISSTMNTSNNKKIIIEL